jgi:hypothetical protein
MHVRVFNIIGEDHYHHHYIVIDTLIYLYQKQSFKIKRIKFKKCLFMYNIDQLLMDVERRIKDSLQW